MAGPEDEREEQGEDLFEDLDKYFAPIKDSDWPEAETDAEEEPSPPQAPTPQPAGGSLDDWGGVEIDLPEEGELLGGAADPATPPPILADEPQPTAVDAPLHDAAEPTTPEPAEPAETPSAPGEEWLFDEGDEADDWERFRRSLGETEAPAADTTEADRPVPAAAASPAASTSSDPDLASELAAAIPEGPADVEAAAEHFAESVRGSPEDVERELLADLEEPTGTMPGTIRVDPSAADLESAPPPAWEEPTIAGPEDLERPAAATGRNLPAAVISGALLAIGAVALLAIGPGPFAFLAAVVVLIGQGELYAVLKSRGAQPATALGLVVGLIMVVGGYLRGEAAILFGLFLAMALAVLWYMAAPPPARKNVVQNVGATLLGIVYVPFLASFALVILRVPGVGRNLLLTVLGLTVLYDVSAYAVGSLWGSRPLAPTVSPKKSWEGAVGATFVLLLVALAIVPSVDPFTAAKAVGLALVLAVAAPIGDLVESALKRDLRVKDMGSILPGHGGILDRIDSILLAAPASYYFLLLTA